MGLLNTEIEVCLIGRNVSYYEKLGYEIPKEYDKYGRYRMNKGTKIMVKIEDLMPTSAIKVDVECDGGCGKILHPTYRDYNKHCHDGKYYCRTCCAKILLSGENHFNYNPNITDEERRTGRDYPEYNDFIKIVLMRDNYTCQCCKKKHDDLEVHHLDGFDWCKDKRTDETNGITLCKDCHSNFHTHYGYGNNTKEQFEEWIGRSIKLIKSGIKILPPRQIYCIETNATYDNAKDACQKLNFNIKSRGAILDMCNKKRGVKSVRGYHFLWYDEYTKMTQKDVLDFLENYCRPSCYRKVICIESKEVFNCISDASKKYGGSPANIRNACSNRYRVAFNLHWMYYNEYLNAINNNEEIILPENNVGKSVICLSTGKIFDKVIEGANNYNCNPTGISLCCKNKLNYSGKLTNGTKLIWMYYEDFLKLPIEEQNEILEINQELSNDDSFIM